jgi:hypothetical protein
MRKWEENGISMNIYSEGYYRVGKSGTVTAEAFKNTLESIRPLE